LQDDDDDDDDKRTTMTIGVQYRLTERPAGITCQPDGSLA
jgi:hypothetical protein